MREENTFKNTFAVNAAINFWSAHNVNSYFDGKVNVIPKNMKNIIKDNTLLPMIFFPNKVMHSPS